AAGGGAAVGAADRGWGGGSRWNRRRQSRGLRPETETGRRQRHKDHEVTKPPRRTRRIPVGFFFVTWWLCGLRAMPSARLVAAVGSSQCCRRLVSDSEARRG